MSKGPRQYTVIKVVRMTAEDAAVLSLLARLGKVSESEALRILIRRAGIAGGKTSDEVQDDLLGVGVCGAVVGGGVVFMEMDVEQRVMPPRIVPCREGCGCAYCDVERSGGETVRTAAKRVLQLFDHGNILFDSHDGDMIRIAFTALREHLR